MVICLTAVLSLFAPVAQARPITPTKVYALAKKYQDPDPTLIVALAEIESSFNPKALGRHGDRGLIQIRLPTARMLGMQMVENLNNPEVNVRYASKYLNYQRARYSTLRQVIAAYNAGSAFICRTGRTKSGKPCTVGRLVNKAYVDKVLAAKRRYDRVFTTELGSL